MSLINDALKHAKQTQQDNPPATPPLQFQPVESGPPNHRGTLLLFVGLALVLALVVALGGLVIWFVVQKSAGELRVAAKTVDEPAPAAVAVAVEPETNALPVTVTNAPPPPGVPKLQGITFHPTRPLAVVNDRTVVVGDRVGGFRVVAITRSSVTLGSATATNVLSLSE